MVFMVDIKRIIFQEKKLRYGVAWSEVCWFVDCPYCGTVQRLGLGNITRDFETICSDDDCGASFICGPGSDED